MTEDDSDKDTPTATTRNQEQQASAEADAPTSKDTDAVTEAKGYARMAAEQPARLQEEQSRIIELLGTEVPADSIKENLKRRAAASAALARLADDEVEPVVDHLDTLVAELRTERTREMSTPSPQMRSLSREVTENLVRTVGRVIAAKPAVVADIDASAYVASITTDLETETLRIATKALFASAAELQQPDAPVETLGALVGYPDRVVQAWGAGALGQVATEHPDVVAPVAEDLRGLLQQEAEPVQHNAVEALGALVGERPEVVVPAAPALRALLDHEEVPIQHNAAGVLGQLAETHPEAVLPAVPEFKRLCDHDDEAIRQIAVATLARLADGNVE